MTTPKNSELRPCQIAGQLDCHSIEVAQGNRSVSSIGPQLGAPEVTPQLTLVDNLGNTSTFDASISSDASSLTLSTPGSSDGGWVFTFQSN